MMLNDNPKIGIGFIKGGPNEGIIRDANNAFHYPEDLFGEIHLDGQILTGAVWDMRKEIGLELSRKLTHFAKHGTPDATNHGEAFADYFLEILVVDDDDANFANGTPNSGKIIPAFIKHGIPASGMTISRNALRDANGILPIGYPVSGSVSVIAAIGNRLRPDSAKIVWSSDNWKTSMNKQMKFTTATRFDDTLPAQNTGAIVRYYIDVKDNFGSYQRKPSKAPSQSYIFLVGLESKIFDRMETNSGWTVNPDGNDNARSGIWQLAVPRSATGQPSVDHSTASSDSMCWITGASNQLGDVDSGKTTILSPTYDLRNYRLPVLRYWRWYTNNLSDYPSEDIWIVQISSDNGQTWVDLERTKESITDWTARAYYVKDYIQLSDKVRLRCIASDDGGDSRVEAAFDDLEFLDLNPLASDVIDQTIPSEITLYQIFPNPVAANQTPSTINFFLPNEEHVVLRIMNHFGQTVRLLLEEPRSPGLHSVTFDAHELPSGISFYELYVSGKHLVKKWSIVR